MHRVPANAIGGKGDWIGFRHEIAISHIDDRGIFAHLGRHDEAFVFPGKPRYQPAQLVVGQLSRGITQRSHARPRKKWQMERTSSGTVLSWG